MASRLVLLHPGRAVLTVAWLLPLACLILSGQQASAQQMQVWPSFRDSNGPSIEIETEDNVRCRYSQGARPSFSMAGLSFNPNSSSVDVTVGNGNTTSAMTSQLGGGLMLTIPFGGNTVDGCGRLTALQENRSKLALGSALLEQGLITQEQFQQLGASIAKQLGIASTGASPSGRSTKQVYVPPPPLNLGPASPTRPAGQPGGIQPAGGPTTSGANPFKQRFPPMDTGSGSGPAAGAPAAMPPGATRSQPGAPPPWATPRTPN